MGITIIHFNTLIVPTISGEDLCMPFRMDVKVLGCGVLSTFVLLMYPQLMYPQTALQVLILEHIFNTPSL